MFAAHDEVLTALNDLANVDFASEPAAAVNEQVEWWAQAVSRLQAVGAPLLAAWDAQQGWAEDGAVNGAQWLRSFGEVESGSRHLRIARRLREYAPLTLAALAAGELSYAKAARMMDAVTDSLGATYRDCEAVLLETAKVVSLRQVTTLVRRWREAALDTLDIDDRAKERRDGRYLRLWETFDGLIAIEGLLDPEVGAIVKRHIEERERQLLRDDVTEARVATGEEPPEDDEELSTRGLSRTPGQRRADALADLVQLGADRGIDDERVGGPGSELHLSADVGTVVEAAVQRARRTNLVLPGLEPQEEGGPLFATNLPPLVERLLQPADPATRGRIQNAFDTAVDRMTDQIDVGGGATLDDHEHPVDLTLVDLLACDCTLSRVVLDANGVALDLGRSQRVANRAQRRELRRRDGGCAFPGCDRPPAWCDAHHIIPWILFGPTDIDNLVLLCRRHHHLMHTKEPWSVRIDPTTRRPVFTKPNGEPARQPGLPPPPGPAPPTGDPPRLARAA